MAEDIANNRKALRDYHIVDRYEAGLELKGTEVKSIRLGHVNINDAFARIDQGAPVLHQADIQPYAKASAEQHDPRRERRLLLHKPESRNCVQPQPSRATRWWHCGSIGKMGASKSRSAWARESSRPTNARI